MLIAFPERKMNFILLTFILFIFSYSLKSQEYVPVEIAQNKSLNIYFSSNVIFCDAGASAIKFETNEKIVKVQSTQENFPETNLTVITADSLCYNFLLLYNELPRVTFVTADPKKAKKLKILPVLNKPPKETVITPTTNTEKTVSKTSGKAPVKITRKEIITRDTLISRTTKKLYNAKPDYYDIAVAKNSITLTVTNIESDDSSLYIVLAIINKSSSDYNIAFVNFQIFVTEKIYKEPMRDLIKRPIYIYNTKDVIKRRTTEKMVYVFDKFKIADNQKLYIELGEKNGPRMYTVKIPPKLLK